MRKVSALQIPMIQEFLHTIPLIDGHCHPPRRHQPDSEEAFKSFFTESTEAHTVAAHVPHTLFYQQSLRDLALLLDCATDAQTVLAQRASLSVGDYLRRLVQRADLRGLVVDYGYRPEESYTHVELQQLLEATPCRVWYVLRLETLIERLLQQHDRFARFLEAYVTALGDLRRQGVTALKSIIAYRTGLHIQRPDAQTAARAFARVQQEIRRQGQVRIANKPLLDFLIPMALEAAAREEIPVQFHTGLGDPDIDMLQGNPLLLRPLLEEPRFRQVPIVLLHCYPYLREAAYLSSIYSNVYLDLSLTIPMLHLALPSVFAEVLGLAPVSKVLYGSDAPGLPDFFWLGAVACRRALACLLDDWMRQGLPEAQARVIAERIMYANSCALYGITA